MNILTHHPAILAIAAYWIYSAIVGGMPAPDDASGKGYMWLYSSLHILAGNISAAVASKFPNLPNASQIQQQKTETITVKS